MADADEEQTVAERLGRLLDRGLLPAGGPAEAAERLIERLQRPARVALLGLPGSGKSAILNLLAGTIVVPESLRLPTIIVQHSDEPRMLCTLADGQVVTVPGADLEKVLVLSPALITLELDLPALKVISLLEVAAGPMEAEQRRAALWAGKRADILIWCSTAYLPKEQLVWEGLPEAYKDNGFLLLTKVDLLGGREAATGMHQRVMQRATGEFRHVLPISAKDARAAATVGKPIDRDRFRESGAAAVISTIKSRIQLARQADMDTAELLLARHAEVVETPQRPKYELRAVEAAPSIEMTEDALAAEAEALRRVAAAASQPTAPDPKPETESRPDTAVHAPSQDRSARTIEIDPFPEPEGAGEDIGESEPVSTKTDDSLVESLRMLLGARPGAPASAPPKPVPTVTHPEVGEALHPAREEAGQTPTEDDGEASPPEAASQLEGNESSPRFAARLKQISSGTENAPTELVPLRATWKSRSDMVSAMPIVPKPEPNRNPTQRPLPEGVGSARLVGRVARPADQSTDLGANVVTAEDQTVEREAKTDAAKPHVDDAPVELPEPVSLEQTAVHEPPQVLTAEAPAALDEIPDPGISDVEIPPPAALPDVQDQPAAERQSLSERLRRPVAPVSVARVVRPASAMPTPQEIVGPRMENTRDTRADAPQVERRERPRIAPRVLPAVPASQVPQTTISAPESTLIDQGIAVISARSVELYDQIDPDERPPVDQILDHVGESVDQVLAILSRGTSPQIVRIRSSFGEIQDLIMLMQLEKGRAPADDALTLLLQLRREMETLRVV